MPRRLKNISNTATKQPKKMPKGKPFKKNNPETGEIDERINRSGRPINFDQLRALGQRLGHELAHKSDGKPILSPEGQAMTTTELIMRQMMTDPKQRLDWLFITYGKPAERREVTGKDGAPLGSPALDMSTLGKYLSDGDLTILQQAAEIIERAQRVHETALTEDNSD